MAQTRRGESARSFYALPIDFPAMANLHYDHQQFAGLQDAVRRHFEPQSAPRLIPLRLMEDEVIPA